MILNLLSSTSIIQVSQKNVKLQVVIQSPYSEQKSTISTRLIIGTVNTLQVVKFRVSCNKTYELMWPRLRNHLLYSLLISELVLKQRHVAFTHAFTVIPYDSSTVDVN